MVMGLEKQVKLAKDKLREVAEREAASREAAILEVEHQAIDEFKLPKEYAALQNYDTGYDKGIEEIFYNIWRKRREVDYRLMEKEYRELIADWEEQEKNCELDTKWPPSSTYSDDDCEIVGQKEPADDANNHAPKA